MRRLIVLICSIIFLSLVCGQNQTQNKEESLLEDIRRADEEEAFADFNVQCPPPTPPDNGYYIPPISLETGSVVHVKCNHSYHLLGGNTIECQAVPDPFHHRAAWFHQVGNMYYASVPECIRQVPKRDDQLKDQTHGISPGDYLNTGPYRVPPSPLQSLGRPKQVKDEHGTFGPEHDCISLPETGMCKASKIRYYYKTQTSKCEQFTYGGCGGNKNNYLSKELCEAACKTDKSNAPSNQS